MSQAEAASIVDPRKWAEAGADRSSTGQGDLTTVGVPAQRQVEALSIEIQQIGR